jgi:hypothetical protein
MRVFRQFLYGVLGSSAFRKVRGTAIGSRARGILVISVSWYRVQQAREISEFALKV